MSDMNFEALLAEHNQAFKDAEEYSDWMPDDGEYTVSVTKIAKDVSTKDGVSTNWWKITAKVEAGENATEILGQEFTLGFYSTKALGILKSQVKALNGGKGVESLAEADAVIEAAQGKILRVKVVTKTSTKNGQDYTNCYIQEVLATQDVQEQPAAPPQG